MPIANPMEAIFRGSFFWSDSFLFQDDRPSCLRLYVKQQNRKHIPYQGKLKHWLRKLVESQHLNQFPIRQDRKFHTFLHQTELSFDSIQVILFQISRESKLCIRKTGALLVNRRHIGVWMNGTPLIFIRLKMCSWGILNLLLHIIQFERK